MRKHVASIPLVVGTAGAVAQDATEYSESVPFRLTTGNSGMILTSTAGSITVTQQVSANGEDWYDAVSTAGASLGGIVVAQTVTTGKWIAFETVLGPYIRFKVKENNSAATVATIELIFQEEL